MTQKTNEKKHTPGPWSAHDCSVHPTEGDDGQRFHDVVAGDYYKSTTESHLTGYIPVGCQYLAHVHGENREANACLIAAAPCLLEALENLENDDGSIPDHAWKMVQSAIAKAKGE